MKIQTRYVAALILFVLLLPFAVLAMALGISPTKGFCIENPRLASMGEYYSADAAARPHFFAPELSSKYQRISGGVLWPMCARTRHGVHRVWAGIFDRQIERLGEFDLREVSRADPSSQILRLVTAPSFSRVAVAFTLRTQADGAGEVTITWLEDDGMRYTYNETTRPDPRAYENWRHASLPRKQAKGILSHAEVQHAWAVARATSQCGLGCDSGLDGTQFALEMTDRGAREVRSGTVGAPETAALICLLASAVDLPRKLLDDAEIQSDGVECPATPNELQNRRS